mmetsp:Transcript_7249/g.13326  ORF Transcript_7249/g.13326 Transcript_7249/m.13326 type:complete len:124 (+) Transcript_7249:810-1181(+)
MGRHTSPQTAETLVICHTWSPARDFDLAHTTATYFSRLQRNPDRFLPFILSLDDGDGTACLDIVTFCAREVEPMGRECEQIHIIALCEALGVSVAIEYLDGSSGPLACLTLPEVIPKKRRRSI